MIARRTMMGAALASPALLGRAALAQANREAVTILVRNDSVGFDPHKVTGRGAAEILFMVTDTLVALEDNQKTVHPLLARSWTVSPDGTTYTFQIREDVTFHSGRALTAEDVAYSLRRLVAPETRSPAAWRAGPVKSIAATGPHTVEYVLERPYNELLLQLAQSFGAIIDREEVEARGNAFGSTGLNGTGPWRWGEWRPRERFVLNRNDAYRWGPAMYENRSAPAARQVIWQVVLEETNIVAAMASGNADITYVAPEWGIENLRRDPRLTLAEPRVSNYSAFLGLRTNREFTSDVRVRQAMSLAVDRAELVRTLWFGQAGAADSYINPVTLDWSAEGRVASDRARANALLDEAGWARGSDGIRAKDGKRLSPELIAANTPGWRTRLGAIQGYLRNAGMDLRLLMPEPAAAMSRINASPDYDAYALFQPYGTAGEALMPFHSRNIPAPNRVNWRDSETDRLLDAGQVALDDSGRAAAYAAVQKIVAEKALVIPLAHERLFLFTNRRVSGAKVHGIYNCGIYKGMDLRIAR